MKASAIFVAAAIMLMLPVALGMTMQGYVFDTSGNWLSGARISCSNSANTYAATSGQDGYYSMQGMEQGKYTCSASKPGFRSAYREVNLQMDYQRVDFYLPDLPSTYGSLEGYVFYSDMSPASGVMVKCGNSYTATTDADGYYMISGIPEGSYVCTADSASHSSVTIVAGETSRRNFYLSSGEPSISRIYGFAYLGSSRLGGVRVECGGNVAYTNSDGYYVLYLDPGYYSCSFESPYGTEYWSGYVHDTRVDVRFYQQVSEHQIYGYVRSGSLYLSGVRVMCDGKATYTDSSGYYAITVPDGIVSCSYTKPGYGEAEWSGNVHDDVRVDISLYRLQPPRVYGYVSGKDGRLGGVQVTCNGRISHTDSSGYYSMEVGEGYVSCYYAKSGYSQASWKGFVWADTRVDIFLEKSGFTVSGVVRSESGIPIPGAKVTCNGKSAYTNLLGKYSVNGMSGWVTCRAEKSGYEPSSSSFHVSTDVIKDFILRKHPVTLSGNAFPSGTRVVCRGPETKYAYSSPYYSLTLSPGTYDCEFSKQGYQKQSRRVYLYSDKSLDVSLKPECSYSFTVSHVRESERQWKFTIRDRSSCAATYHISTAGGCGAVLSSNYVRTEPGGTAEFTVRLLSSGCSETIFVGSRKITIYEPESDTSPPEISVSHPLSYRSGEQFRIRVTASDESGIDRIVISGDAYRECRSSYCEIYDTGSADRHYTITAWDRAGNAASEKITVSLEKSEERTFTTLIRAVEVRRAEEYSYPWWRAALLLVLLFLIFVVLAMLLSSLFYRRK